MKKKMLVYVFIVLLLATGVSLTSGKPGDTTQEMPPGNLVGEELFSYLNRMALENRKVAPASSLIYATRALEVATELNNMRFQTEAHNSLGAAHSYMNSFGDALSHFFKALDLLEQVSDSSLMANTLNNIGNVYFLSGSKELAIQYYTRSLLIKETVGNDKTLSSTLINLASLSNDVGDQERAVQYINRAIEIIDSESDSAKMSSALNNLGSIYLKMGDYLKALHVNQKALEISIIKNNRWDESYISGSLGEIYLAKEKPDQALPYILRGLETARDIHNINLELLSTRQLLVYHSMKGNFSDFLSSFRHYEVLKDSVFSEENSRAVAEMQVIYLTGQKEKENAINKLRIAKEANLRNSFVFVSVIVLIMITVIYFRYHKKRKLNEELERLVQLRTADLVKSHSQITRLNETLLTNTIETEERERRRFSEDLHDGIGPLLSTAKIHMELIASRRGQPEEQQKLLKVAEGLIDDAIHSAKEIANNLTPNILNDFGLSEAIQVYIEKINRFGAVSITFNTNTAQRRYPKKIELALYRICLELINNTLKHSGAKNVRLNLEGSDTRLLLSYRDDGRGFDLDETESGKQNGLGMSNILSRIRLVNGSYNINTSAGKAFEMTIDIETNQ